YGELLGCWRRYTNHVNANVGGVYEIIKTPEQEGDVYAIVPRDTQKASVEWLHKNVFETPEWLLAPHILQNTRPSGYSERLRRLQVGHLNGLMSFTVMARLIDSETLNEDRYAALEMLQDLRTGIWSELRTGKKVDLFRRNLQRSYLSRMDYLMHETPDVGYDTETSDVRALVRGELLELKKQLKLAKSRTTDTMTKYHYEDALGRIEAILDDD
ncbi:MAG: zinc-dependent metalloprotease, partial [Bacteroidota bacterium]